MVLEEIHRKNSNEVDLLQASIDEIDSVTDQMEQQKADFVPLKTRCRDLIRSCIEICHKIVSDGLEITHNARDYQSAQMTNSMDQMKLRDDASSRSSRRSTRGRISTAGLQNSPNNSKSGSAVPSSIGGVLDREMKPVDDSDERSIQSGNSGLTVQSELNAMKPIFAQNSFGRKSAQATIEFSSSDSNLVWNSCDPAGNTSLNRSASGFVLAHKSKLNVDVHQRILLQKKFHDMTHAAIGSTNPLQLGRKVASANDITASASPSIRAVHHRADVARTLLTSFSMQNMH